ncbi:MAG: hypothetical protein J6B31_07820 [Bacteroidaceae bacterium]|nr:hypothetical protein [Bacteroidaceae bacterium]
MNKIEKSFIQYVYSKARESETLDINNRRKPFIQRNGRFLIAYPFTVFVLCTLLKGYSNDFLQLSSSILSILIGLFLTALVFALDKFYVPHKNNIGDYKLDVNENEEIRNIEISIDKIEFENAQERLWQKQSLYYVQKFNVLVGKSVIVGVWALALICLNVMYLDFFSINFSDYTFVPITFQSFLTFFQLLIVGFVRFFICYYMVEVFYNTIRIISSMVNFMSVRIKR